MAALLHLLLVCMVVSPGVVKGDTVTETQPEPGTPPASEPETTPEPGNTPAPTQPEASTEPECPEACETCCIHGVCQQDEVQCRWIPELPNWATVLSIVGGVLLVTMLVSWLLKACSTKKNPEDDWLREHLLSDKIPTVRAGDPFDFKSA